MTTTFLRLSSNAPFGSFGLRVIPRDVDGVPGFGLANAFKFKETTLAAGLKDDVTGVYYLTDGAPLDSMNTESMQAGGGVKFGGWRYLLGPTFNIQNPWTIAFTMTRTPPVSIAASVRAVLGIGTHGVAGFTVWQQALTGEVITAGGKHGLYQQRWNGSMMATANAIAKPYVAVFGSPETIVITHAGGGAITEWQIKDGDVSIMADTWNMSTIIASTPNLPAKFGAPHDTWKNDSAVYDLAAIYTRALSLEEAKVFAAAGKALANARGRI
ncbi:hypothetical protein [Rhizobium rhizogenes]|uniref:hypothetical protein n=1 Tax=Rhizobium rhizogenes TaxID=359 RepID=UPI0015725A93|nr:hypothetical protein [Rhizobium rhizogenes]MDJ1638670.1 hypothetical protein [Rhizobium rhizogenes]NTG78123.1 hypothetical protein [Rhizobium rhizogenes]NTH23353.1 hypothetical protein [Rhizobium rhizogenes]NTH36375.1 hypothetical protein [Rhizobium rhizogenes]